MWLKDVFDMLHLILLLDIGITYHEFITVVGSLADIPEMVHNVLRPLQ